MNQWHSDHVYRHDPTAEKELLDGLPFLDIAFADREGFAEFVGDTFATDRFGAPKGMIEVIL